MSFDPDKYMDNQDASAKLKKPDAQGHTGLQNALHLLVKGLPLAGGTVGGIVGAPGVVTGAAGVGLGATMGHGLQKAADQAMGYEKPDFVKDALEITKTGVQDATAAMGTTAALKLLGAAAGPLSKGAMRIKRAIMGTPETAAGDAVLNEATDAGAFRMGRSLKDNAKSITTGREAAEKRLGEIKDELDRQGIMADDRDNYARAFADKLQQIAPGTGDAAERKVYTDAINEMLNKEPGAFSIPQAESIKSSFQGQTKYGVPEPGRVTQFKQNRASMMRQMNEDAIQRNTQAELTNRERQGLRPAIVNKETGMVHVAKPGEMTHAQVFEGIPPDEADAMILHGNGDLERGFVDQHGLYLPRHEALEQYGASNSAALAQPRRLPAGNGEREVRGARVFDDSVTPVKGTSGPYPGTDTVDASPDLADLARDFVPAKHKVGNLVEAERLSTKAAEHPPDLITQWLLSHALLHPSTAPATGAAMVAKRLINTRGANSMASMLTGAGNAAGAVGQTAERAGPALSLWGTEEKPDVAAILQTLMQKKPLEQKPSEPAAFDPEIYMSGVGR